VGFGRCRFQLKLTQDLTVRRDYLDQNGIQTVSSIVGFGAISNIGVWSSQRLY